MKNIFFTILVLTALGQELFTEELTTYTAVTRGFGIKIFDGAVYAATDGGLIVRDGTNYTVYDTDDGIYEPVIEDIEKDFRGMLWLGHPDCSVTVYDIERKEPVYLDDIAQSGVYELNAVFSSSEYVYIAASGLLARYRYNDDFNKYEISEINSMTGVVSDVKVTAGTIYISTASGAYSIAEDSPNINYLNNWTKISGLDAAGSLNGLAVNGETVYVLAQTGLFRIDGTGTIKETVYNGIDLKYGYFGGGEFLAAHEQVDAMVISSVPDDLASAPQIIFGTGDENFGSFCRSGDIIYFTSTGGFSFYSVSNDEEYRPSFNVPNQKGIQKAALDASSGRLIYLTNSHFSYMDTSDYTFSDTMYSAKATGDGAKNILVNNGRLYICTWGAGVNTFDYNEPDYSYFSNFSFGSALEGVNYPVHPGIAEDSEGNLWISNWGDKSNPDGSTLIRLAPDGTDHSYLTRDYFYGYDVFADTYDGRTWIWTGSSKQSFGAQDGIGVGVFDGVNLSFKRILISDGVIDIAADKDNVIWIATNNGIRYIDLALSPSDPQSFSSVNINNVQTGPVGNVIYDVEVNSINEKWFATDKGISVLSADGNSWRHYVPMSYSGSVAVPGEIIKIRLPDASINEILFIEEEGIAVIGSYNGLSFLEYGKVFKTGEVNKNEIQTKPSPFINDGSSVMGFYFPEDGNSYDTGRIFDMKGFLVRGGEGGNEFSINNGWDGRDNKGKLVSTGIYKMIAYNKNDPSQNITGKIAVVRK
ncbi:MAG TPA: two-component regulator propeller domain-containing protein [Clostridiales bacterium]|nr:two-component regulator propeller domain-containing protein [Clostridiales bacterium]